MGKTLPKLGLALCVVTLAATAAHAQEHVKPATAVNQGRPIPDFSGPWQGTYTVTPSKKSQPAMSPEYFTRWAPWPPPLTAAYKKLAADRAAAQAQLKAGDTSAACRPVGLPFAITGGEYAKEFIQTPSAVRILVAGSYPITIWTDGRPHPKDLKPSINGHTIGYWSGNVLYTDTIGLLDTPPVASGIRFPHSGKLDVKMAFHKVAPDILHVTVTLLDDEALTEPMVTTNIWRRPTTAPPTPQGSSLCIDENNPSPETTGGLGAPK